MNQKQTAAPRKRQAFPTTALWVMGGCIALAIGPLAGRTLTAFTGETLTGTGTVETGTGTTLEESISAVQSSAETPSSATGTGASAASRRSSSKKVSSDDMPTASSATGALLSSASGASLSSETSESSANAMSSVASASGTSLSSEASAISESSQETSESEARSSESSASSDRLETLTGLTLDETYAQAVPATIAPTFLIPKHPDIANADELRNRLTLTVTDIGGESMEPFYDIERETEGFRITLTPASSFTPGRYQLQAELGRTRGITRALQKFLRQTEGSEGKEETVMLLDTFFDWGNIAFNTDRDIYTVGDDAAVFVAAIDQKGLPLCAEQLSLHMGEESKTVDDFCSGNEPIALSMRTAATQTLSLSLAQADGATQRTQQTVVTASKKPLITVQRDAATRTHPGTEESMTITVRSDVSIVGSVKERIPAGFSVISTTPAANVQSLGEDETEITWDGALSAGTSRTYQYTVRVPETSPLFGLFGPIQIRGTMETPVVPSSASSSFPSSELSSSEASVQELSSATGSLSTSSEASSAAYSSEERETSEHVSSATEASSVEESIASSSSAAAETPAAVSSIDSAASEESSATSQQSAEPLSWLSRFLASLITEGETVSFTEDRQWQMLSVYGEPQIPELERSIVLERQAAVFDANYLPSFRLVDTVLSEGNNAILTEEKFLKKEVAMQEVLHAVIAQEEVSAAVLTQVVQNQADVLAEQSLLNETVREEAEIRGRRMNTDAATVVATAIRANASDALTTIATDDAAVQEAIDRIPMQEVTEKLVNTMAQSGTGSIDVDKALSELVANDTQSISAMEQAVLHAVAKDPATDNAVLNAVESTKRGAASPSEGKPVLTLKLTDAQGNIIENPPFHFEVGSVMLVLDPIRTFRPGLYTLEVQVTNPLTNETQTLYQQFAWGVLAMNPDADRYKTGETAKLDIGVLDNNGAIVCDAKLTLDVVAPDGSTTQYSTKKQSIETTGTCGRKEAGLTEPDYTTGLPLKQAGTYTLTLTAETANGIRSMVSEIVVEDDPLFRIRRTGATRLWPLAASPMSFAVQFGSDVEGEVLETLPPGFTATILSPKGTVSEQADGTVILRWAGSWKAGEKVTFLYSYDAPDVSPEYYLLGPISIRSHTPPQSE